MNLGAQYTNNLTIFLIHSLFKTVLSDKGWITQKYNKMALYQWCLATFYMNLKVKANHVSTRAKGSLPKKNKQ